MTKETALDRIKKAEEFISKKQNTISKKQKGIEKKLAELQKTGFTYTGKQVYTNELEGFSKDIANTIYWLVCDVTSYESDIRRLEKEIAEKEQKLPEYRTALEEAEQRERIIANEIPESMKEAKQNLIEAWTQYDLRFQATMRKDREEMEWREFSKKYAYTTREDYMYKSEADFRKRNEKEATIWLLDLYNRVKEITGNITDAKHIHWGGKALDGYIVGEKGTAEVFTVEAGGYNIQRWHLRVLVKSR